LVCGFWHGASWTFLAWGLINALYFLPLLLLGANRRNVDTVAKGKILPGIKELSQMLTTFVLATLAWIFFRAESMTQALSYIGNMFTKTLIVKPNTSGLTLILPALLIMVIVEWLQRDKQHGLEGLRMNIAMRWSVYLGLTTLVYWCTTNSQKFIYFNF
jgi:D-alanyl-lipoteichoic acid acyltransferase DltB (MBOAT superfamily)